MKGKGMFAWVTPIVDSFVFVEDSYLEDRGWKKAKVVPITKEDALELAKQLKFEKHLSGGIAMNVSRAVGVLGYPTTIVGQRGDDDRGEVVRDVAAQCGLIDRMIVKPNFYTTNVILFVTPDAQRTMIIIDGASNEPFVENIEPSIIDEYDLVLTDAFQVAISPIIPLVTETLNRGKQMGKKTVLILGSGFEIPGFRDSVVKVLDYVTILSGTLEEHMALFAKSSKEELLAHLEKSNFELCAVTMGAEGSYLVANGKSHFFPAPEVANVIDTTGAGDSYAAGLIYSYLNGYPIEVVGKAASKAAGYTVARVGINLEKDFKDEVSKVLG